MRGCPMTRRIHHGGMWREWPHPRCPESRVQQRGDLLDRDSWGHPPRGDSGLDARQLRSERRIGFETREHALFEHGPHPFHLLLSPAHVELSRLTHALAMVEDAVP